MKPLIFGASGLIGNACARLGDEYCGTINITDIPCIDNHGGSHLLRMELSTFAMAHSQPIKQISEFIEKQQPDCIINAVAWSHVDGCEANPEKALLINAELPRQIAMMGRRFSLPIVHLSTSYVFDGEKEVYTESDSPNPLSEYGKSKLSGETAVMEVLPDHSIIARTIFVFGEEILKKNFYYQVRRAVTSGTPLNVPCDQWGNPTYVETLAAGLIELLRKKRYGLFNVCGNESMTKYRWACEILDSLNAGHPLAMSVKSKDLGQPAPRPFNASLSNEKFSSACGISFDSLNNDLVKMLGKN